MRLRFWIQNGLQTALIGTVMPVVYSLLMSLQMTTFDWTMLLPLMPIYLLIFGAMILMAMNIGVYKLALPLALSFGSTRSEAFVGLQLFRLIPTFLLILLSAAVTLLIGDLSVLPLSMVFSVGISAFLIAGAIGTFVGVLFTKFGKLGALISVFIILFCAFVGGFAAAMSNDVGWTWLQTILQAISLRWLIPGIGLILYGISILPEQRTVWKCNVKL